MPIIQHDHAYTPLTTRLRYLTKDPSCLSLHRRVHTEANPQKLRVAGHALPQDMIQRISQRRFLATPRTVLSRFGSGGEGESKGTMFTDQSVETEEA